MRCDSVILVENLDVCRYFYRNTLGLGEPVIDSNYAVAFPLADGAMLILEKVSVNFMEHASGAIRLVFHVDDLDAFAGRLAGEGVVVEKAFSCFYENALRISDPEGNVILLV